MVNFFRVLFRVLGFVLGLCGLVLFIAWRRVHIQLHRTYIVHRGGRITILIEGV